MKKFLFVAFAILISGATTFAQSKTNKLVDAAFKTKFPTATNLKWDKENDHEFEADFMANGLKYSANFSDKGEWLETESSITFDKLPVKVKTAYNTAHEGAKVKAVAKIETSNGAIKYEIEAKKGLKTIEFFYNAEGKLIK